MPDWGWRIGGTEAGAGECSVYIVKEPCVRLSKDFRFGETGKEKPPSLDSLPSDDIKVEEERRVWDVTINAMVVLPTSVFLWVYSVYSGFGYQSVCHWRTFRELDGETVSRLTV